MAAKKSSICASEDKSGVYLIVLTKCGNMFRICLLHFVFTLTILNKAAIHMYHMIGK